ncbi:MAG: hypothetical protein AB1758_26685, partial [Candidatus Eremiobacterota bacterium]
AVERCQWLVAQRFGPEADPSIAEAAQEVLSCLARLLAMPPEPDPELVVSEREALRAATENLSMFVAVMSSDDEVLDVVQGEGLAAGAVGVGRGLPMMLSSLLDAGDRFLQGEATREELEESIVLLESTVNRTQSQLASSREARDRGQLVRTALDHLKAAVDAMRDLGDNKGGRTSLERAEAEMHAAHDAMKQLETTR